MVDRRKHLAQDLCRYRSQISSATIRFSVRQSCFYSWIVADVRTRMDLQIYKCEDVPGEATFGLIKRHRDLTA